MAKSLREQACWLLLVFESGLTTRIVNNILVSWCKDHGRTLEDFFNADPQEWNTICQLDATATQKLLQAQEKLTAQAFLAEQLQHDGIRMITVLDPEYPATLKKALGRNSIPPVLFVMGNLELLEQKIVAIIGSRNASDISLSFTKDIAQYLSDHRVNVISGYARGVDKAAFEGATSHDGWTTVVLPQGIRTLSKAQMKYLQSKIEAGNVLVLSQFHPDARWLVSRAMERNNVVTGLAQIVIVAESDTKGGTWEGANNALRHHKRVYVRQATSTETLPGNAHLIERGGQQLSWPVDNLSALIEPIVQESVSIQEKQAQSVEPPTQLSLLTTQNHS